MRNVDPLGEFSKEDIGTALRTVRFEQTLNQHSSPEKSYPNAQSSLPHENLPTHAQYLDSNNNLVEDELELPKKYSEEFSRDLGNLDKILNMEVDVGGSNFSLGQR